MSNENSDQGERSMSEPPLEEPEEPPGVAMRVASWFGWNLRASNSGLHFKSESTSNCSSSDVFINNPIFISIRDPLVRGI